MLHNKKLPASIQLGKITLLTSYLDQIRNSMSKQIIVTTDGVKETWLSGDRTERPKLQLPHARASTYRSIPEQHIPHTTICIDGGGPRRLNTKTHSTAFKEMEPDRD
ncbi:unnamed protein product [Cercopithifilaria johnstoni]|uniref:Uncharacterized protein n=1 Tax=Cercopithifilaria johnstoni TaxID=2874296 RepID=A0A8J2M5E1_9BILA|nr:unnamed protein product [Cercopithifilaria johnstoni]